MIKAPFRGLVVLSLLGPATVPIVYILAYTILLKAITRLDLAFDLLPVALNSAPIHGIAPACHKT